MDWIREAIERAKCLLAPPPPSPDPIEAVRALYPGLEIEGREPDADTSPGSVGGWMLEQMRRDVEEAEAREERELQETGCVGGLHVRTKEDLAILRRDQANRRKALERRMPMTRVRGLVPDHPDPSGGLGRRWVKFSPRRNEYTVVRQQPPKPGPWHLNPGAYCFTCASRIVDGRCPVCDVDLERLWDELTSWGSDVY